jgi:hypothetical protein
LALKRNVLADADLSFLIAVTLMAVDEPSVDVIVISVG